MTSHQFHEAASRLSRQRSITLEAARAELSRRSAAKRAKYGRVHVTQSKDFKAVEVPRHWQDRD